MERRMELSEHSTSEDYAALLVGHKIVKAQNDALWTDDGRKLKILPNQGGCVCSAGDYEVTALNTCNNIITSAELEHYEKGSAENIWRLFVYADNQKINAFEVSGDDGNGYYGTGFTVYVIDEPADDDPDARVRGLNDHLL